MQSYDALVVGCGPVGAVLASRLAAAGLDVLVVERATEVHPLPRAVAADDEVQELLSRVAPGCLDGALLDVPVRFLGARGQSVGALRFPPGVGGRPGLALFSQPALEARLRSGLGAELRLGTALVSWEQDASRVTALLDDDTQVRAAWLIGCDGASSAVRAAAGIAWGGRDLRRWLVVDVAGPVASSGFTYSCSPARPAVDMPLPGGHRWEWLLADDEPAFDPRPLLPSGVDVVRCVEYRYGARRASTWRRGRCCWRGTPRTRCRPSRGRAWGRGCATPGRSGSCCRGVRSSATSRSARRTCAR